MDPPNVAVISSCWQERNSELAYIVRALSGAASRWARVSVLSSRARSPYADGAFDVEPLVEPGTSCLPEHVTADCVLLIDSVTAEIARVLSAVEPRRVFYVTSDEPCDPSWRQLGLLPTHGTRSPIKFYVPVNADAARHRHNGFGFTGYHLVLSGRSGVHEGPPTEVAWLTAGLHEREVIAVEDGVAYAWKGRALRGSATVDSRMDLWRLIAHACTCIDLSPGPFIARECVEAMRFGTPIIVPASSEAGAAHAVAGGGSTFADPEELLGAAISYEREDLRSAASKLARRLADTHHGTPSGFVDSLRDVLDTPGHS